VSSPDCQLFAFGHCLVKGNGWGQIIDNPANSLDPVQEPC